MSYEILYNKQFVKLPDNKIIPLVLGGSNNCYEIKMTNRGKEKRSREWFVHSNFFNKGSRYFEDADVYLKNIESFRNKEVERITGPEYWNKDANYTTEDVNKKFGYFISCKMYGQSSCASMSFNSYYNFFKSGIKNAKTIEELKEVGIILTFNVYKYNNIKSQSIPEPKFTLIESTEDFFRQAKIAEEYSNNCVMIDEEGKEHKPYVYLSYIDSYEYVEDKIKKFNVKKEKREKKPIEFEKYYVLKSNDGFLIKYTARGYKYSYYPSPQIKKFISNIEAEKYKQTLINKGKPHAETWKVTPIERNTTFYI
jgi:hypothetical protein